MMPALTVEKNVKRLLLSAHFAVFQRILLHINALRLHTRERVFSVRRIKILRRCHSLHPTKIKKKAYSTFPFTFVNKQETPVPPPQGAAKPHKKTCH